MSGSDAGRTGVAVDGAAQAVAAVARLTSRAVVGPAVSTGRGLGNRSWVVPTAAGAVLLKVARSDLGGTAKVASASAARRRAVAAGVAVPPELAVDWTCAEFGGRLTRVYEYWQGRHPDEVIGDVAGRERFFAGLGRQLARLHAVRFAGFSSRVDGSVPEFARWRDYVDYRAPQIRERARATGAFDAAVVDRLLDRASEVARRLSPIVQPALAHRDVYLDNLLSVPDVRACALLDFDVAEVWDPAVDFVKLRWQVFGRVLGSESACLSAYADAGGDLARFAERLEVVEILELVNTVVGATVTGSGEYEASARRRLDEVVSGLR